ncbi:Hypothetical protein GLP15_1156 [Giardia lamblia P15]|uniref:Uncharacterized protein n=1 Tax=Giardia intestinalis (strain P15) TaxID=658858 RepID=E1F4Q5_GIAIA|nr:Hypothetical protein GLP15_1156 [Giardia lamblia P15]
MENVPRANLSQTVARKTNKFVPVPVRRSDPILERCHVPTVDSAYLKLTDSVTSFNSSVSSSTADSHIVESHVSDCPPQSKSSLTSPLSRLLVPEVSTNVRVAPPLATTNLIDSGLPASQSVSKTISESPHSAETVSSATLAKLLTATAPSASHNFLNYIHSTTSVAPSREWVVDEPAFTVTSVKRSDREIVKAVRQKKDSPNTPQDPYIQSVAMLTQLVTQNTHLVKTALDAISVAAIKPHQVTTPNRITSATVSSSLRPAPQTPQAAQPPQVPHVQPTRVAERAYPQQLFRPPQSNVKSLQRRPTKIPKPATPPCATQRCAPSTPMFTPNDNPSNVKARLHDDLIGVPIRAQEYMPNGPTFDFLNALIKEECHEAVVGAQKGCSSAPVFDPFLNDLVNAASQLDELVNSMCSDVLYTDKGRVTNIAPA